jgi:hypothetical protein
MAIYPGVAEVNREGVELAFEMLFKLKNWEIVDPVSRVSTVDLSQLENWPREGKPFRNVVHEYLARARQSGSAVEAGFCAVLSDFLSQLSAGTCPSAETYKRLYAIGSNDEDGVGRE